MPQGLVGETLIASRRGVPLSNDCRWLFQYPYDILAHSATDYPFSRATSAVALRRYPSEGFRTLRRLLEPRVPGLTQLSVWNRRKGTTCLSHLSSWCEMRLPSPIVVARTWFGVIARQLSSNRSHHLSDDGAVAIGASRRNRWHKGRPKTEAQAPLFFREAHREHRHPRRHKQRDEVAGPFRRRAQQLPGIPALRHQPQKAALGGKPLRQAHRMQDCKGTFPHLVGAGGIGGIVTKS